MLGEPSVFNMQGQTTQPFTIPFTQEHLDNGIDSPQAYQPPNANIRVDCCVAVAFMHVTFAYVKVCTGKHIKMLCEETMITCQYRAGVYVLEGGRAPIICNDTSDEHTPHKHAPTSTAASQPSSMTQQGLGQLRYLGGRCVAKLQYVTVTRLRHHMHINSTAY